VLELNNGKKWVVVPTMMVHIRNIEKDVEAFHTMRGQDHTALAGTIQEHLGQLVLNCTMKGKAHDELHKWLIPFMALTTEYADAANPAEQQQKLQELRQSLALFNAHFRGAA
jgi:hypothetical protein